MAFHWLRQCRVRRTHTISSANVLLWVAVSEAWGRDFLLRREPSVWAEEAALKKKKKLKQTTFVKTEWLVNALLRSGRSEEQVLSKLPRKLNSFSTRNFMSWTRSVFSHDGRTACRRRKARIWRWTQADRQGIARLSIFTIPVLGKQPQLLDKFFPELHGILLPVSAEW